MKKAEEYVQQWNGSSNKEQATLDIVNSMIREVSELVEARNVSSNSGLVGVVREIDQKWRSFAKSCPEINPEGFKQIMLMKIPDINQIHNLVWP